nr:M20 aminoacylase family protein [Delftia acidovorans]
MQDCAPELTGMRRHLHQHPELGFQEFDTSAFVAEKLTAWGYEVERGLGGTGVVGRLRRGTGTAALGIRADMDALPIDETSGVPHSSQRPGVMHACGHDGHTTMLLGAARYLSERGEFSGTLNLIFQPAEEGLGGAVRMMEDGLFEKYPCDAVYALHNWPSLPQGHLMFRDGATMASSDYATITLTGVGGHGALPQHTADPIVAAASIVMALQTIVSRNADPQEVAIVTVGAIHAGKANNVVPEKATLEVSVRSLSKDIRAMLERRLKGIVAAQAESFGVKAEVDYRKGYTVLVNTPTETDFARQVGQALLGEARVEPHGYAITGSEDFAFMLEKKPGCYFFLGNGAAGEHGSCMVHNPGYDFNDANLPIGAAYWAMLAERYLS